MVLKTTNQKITGSSPAQRALKTPANGGMNPYPIALCGDIGPLLIAYSGAGVSDFAKPPALCLKADLAEVAQFH